MANSTNIVQIKPEIIEEIKKSLSTKNRLQFELKKSYLTIQTWLKENSSKLTEVQALRIIREELGYNTIDELLTDPE